MPGPAPASGRRATIWRSRPGSTGSQLGENRTPGTVGEGSGTRTLATGYSNLATSGLAERSRELVEGTRIDFVELEPGDFRFIFAPADEAGAP